MKSEDETEISILFTTGAFIRPQKVTDKDGKEMWVWVVSEFIDDTFLDGKIYNPQEGGETIEKLLLKS
jgi:hypothetical protein